MSTAVNSVSHPFRIDLRWGEQSAFAPTTSCGSRWCYVPSIDSSGATALKRIDSVLTPCYSGEAVAGSVGRPEIQKFVGALQGQRARKGVFITTSTYSSEAIEYATRIDTKVVLIDGERLAELMIDFDVGVAASASYVVKRVDSDYFEKS